MPSLELRGVELAWEERGEGSSAPPVMLIHETGVDRAIWSGVAGALERGGARAIAYDRRGWGASTEPDGYARTTIEEQSEDAAALLESLGAAPAVIAGAGLGAVAALDLSLRRPDLVTASVLVEPPLLSLVPEATELLSADRRALESAAGEGRDALVELYLSGGLGALAAGVGRLPAELTTPARERPASLIAEIGSVTQWGMPIPRLATATRPAGVVVSSATPPVLRAAAEAVASRLAGAELREAGDAGPPHLAAPDEVAAICGELSEAAEAAGPG